MTHWTFLHPAATPEMLGFLPLIFNERDPRPARDQANDRYGHGGGWDPFEGFEFDPAKIELQYPGDPPTRAIAFTILREEKIILYEHAWVQILQPDGSYEISRMD